MVSISSIDNGITLSCLERRKPKGIGISPYPLLSLIRYIMNLLFNGYFSFINPDYHKMKLLSKEGRITKGGTSESYTSSLKVAFLGDIMVSRSGKPPELSANLKAILEEADIIVANVESPVVDSNRDTKRGFSLNFEMSSSFLSSIYSCNHKAKWIFSVANNHACDTSLKNDEDVSGVEATVDNIRAAIPDAEVIGAEIGSAKSVLSLQVEGGPKIGFVAWTELMNRDKKHYKKKVIRETDIKEEEIEKIKRDHSILIGFPHGNVELSGHPEKETRDRWYGLIGERKFDVIVGHGPHVVHPAEEVNEQGLLFHSIGNFCSPFGKSQTKIGCIPLITINYQDDQVSSIAYKIHLLQQQKDSVSIIENLNAKSQIYPNIINRLKKTWNPLFS